MSESNFKNEQQKQSHVSFDKTTESRHITRGFAISRLILLHSAFRLESYGCL